MMGEIIPNRVYTAKKVFYWEDIPFKTVVVKKIDGDIITFTTEWPIRELETCESFFMDNFS